MSPESRACDACLRRSATLATLSARIEHAARDAERLRSLLDLDGGRLIEAIGGRRREELRVLCAAPPPEDSGLPSSCVHAETDEATRAALRAIPGVPAALRLPAGASQLRSALAEPVVAILGSRRASDYGIEVACSLSRGLTLAGVTVGALFADGIGAAALAGALEGGGVPLAAMPGGLDVCRPACLRELHMRLRRDGCALSQLPDGFQPRRWSTRAAGALLAGLSALIVVVEAREEDELCDARAWAELGRPLAAIPGRITSPGAHGPHALLQQGAALLTDPQDVLDLLCAAGCASAPRRGTGPHREAREGTPQSIAIQGLQREVLDRIGSGQDTIGRLAAGPDAAKTLIALAELEARGLIVRGDGGRYLPRLAGNIG